MELIAEVCTRWGSRYDMLQRFLRLKDAVVETAKSLTEKEIKDGDFQVTHLKKMLNFFYDFSCF